jgi:hypothetical protein
MFGEFRSSRRQSDNSINGPARTVRGLSIRAQVDLADPERRDDRALAVFGVPKRP